MRSAYSLKSLLRGFALLIIVVFCQLSGSLASAGGDGGGGGSLVMVNGKLEPADLFYQPHDTIPSTYKPVDFKKYPNTLNALQDAMNFLKLRSVGRSLIFIRWDLAHTEFYFVPKLSGQDPEAVAGGLTPFQAFYTYDIPDLSGRQKPTRHIVEILRDKSKGIDPLATLEKQNSVYGGLCLLHELLHHEPVGGHPVISPLIKALSVLIPLNRAQQAGSRRALTAKEMKASRLLQNILNEVTGAENGQVARNGGGFIIGASDNFDSSNFVGASSTITLTRSSASTDFRNNVFLNSSVNFSGLAAKLVANNTFKNTIFQLNLPSNSSDWPPFTGTITNNVFSHINEAAFQFDNPGAEAIDHNFFSHLLWVSVEIAPKRPVIGNRVTHLEQVDLSLGGSRNTITDIKETARSTDLLLNAESDENFVRGIRFQSLGISLGLRGLNKVESLSVTGPQKTIIVLNKGASIKAKNLIEDVQSLCANVSFTSAYGDYNITCPSPASR